jgi:hypothetical protein
MKGGFHRLFPLGCAEAGFRLCERILALVSGTATRPVRVVQPPNKQGLRLDQEMITSSFGKVRGSINECGTQIDSISASTLTCRSKTMNHEINEARYQEIEPSVLVLGAAYAASLLGMIFWAIA